MPIFQLTDSLFFPPPHLAEDGWLAIGGDLSPERLLLAYRSGIFPWPEGEFSPILWASPDPRTILFLEKYHLSKRQQRAIRQKHFRITFDQAFEAVIKQCATIPRPDQNGTWITKDMRIAYNELHHMGFAHSVETWLGDDLVGGLYGVSLGGVFFGESMFKLVNDASKAAFQALVHRLRLWNFDFIDVQVSTAHVLRWGAQEIDRAVYLGLLKESLRKQTRRGNWGLDLSL